MECIAHRFKTKWIIEFSFPGDLTAYLTVTDNGSLIKSLDEFLQQSDVRPMIPVGTNLEVTLMVKRFLYRFGGHLHKNAYILQYSAQYMLIFSG